MHNKKPKDISLKGTVRPNQVATTLSPYQATSQGIGFLPIGEYKGSATFFDLDNLVNQPTVLAEEKHILGILDGREEDYDLQTLSIAAAEAVGTTHMAQLTVPSGAVWFINSVVTTLPASGGANILTANWYCSLWTDRTGALGYGQPFHANAINFGVGGGIQYDEFDVPGPIWAVTNKPVALRLPAGTVITVIVTNTTAVAAGAVTATFQLYGYVGRTLLE